MMKAQLNSGLSDEAAMELAIAKSLKDVKKITIACSFR
jgi:hypothetical protein